MPNALDKLTPAGRALCSLIVAGRLTEVVALVGRNHPTLKWFERRCGEMRDVAADKAVIASILLDRDHKAFGPTLNGF